MNLFWTIFLAIVLATQLPLILGLLYVVLRSRKFWIGVAVTAAVCLAAFAAFTIGEVGKKQAAEHAAEIAHRERVHALSDRAMTWYKQWNGQVDLGFSSDPVLRASQQRLLVTFAKRSEQGVDMNFLDSETLDLIENNLKDIEIAKYAALERERLDREINRVPKMIWQNGRYYRD